MNCLQLRSAGTGGFVRRTFGGGLKSTGESWIVPAESIEELREIFHSDLSGSVLDSHRVVLYTTRVDQNAGPAPVRLRTLCCGSDLLAARSTP